MPITNNKYVTVDNHMIRTTPSQDQVLSHLVPAQQAVPVSLLISERIHPPINPFSLEDQDSHRFTIKTPHHLSEEYGGDQTIWEPLVEAIPEGWKNIIAKGFQQNKGWHTTNRLAPA